MVSSPSRVGGDGAALLAGNEFQPLVTGERWKSQASEDGFWCFSLGLTRRKPDTKLLSFGRSVGQVGNIVARERPGGVTSSEPAHQAPITGLSTNATAASLTLTGPTERQGDDQHDKSDNTNRDRRGRHPRPNPSRRRYRQRRATDRCLGEVHRITCGVTPSCVRMAGADQDGGSHARPGLPHLSPPHRTVPYRGRSTTFFAWWPASHGCWVGSYDARRAPYRSGSSISAHVISGPAARARHQIRRCAR